jgi:hypothetical protein
MTILHNQSESAKKSLPGLVSANANGLVIHRQDVRWFNDTHEIPEVAVPIAWTGEPTRFRVVLTTNGLMLDERPISEGPREIPGEICYLAALTLREDGDTPETVDVEVPRRVCTTEAPDGVPSVHVVPATLITEEDTPARIAGRRKQRRIRFLRQQLKALKDAGKYPSQFTAAERALVTELLALEHDLPVLVEVVP